MIRPVPALLGLSLALAPAAAPCAPSQSYRVNYQLVRPLNADFRFAVLGSLTQTPGSTGPGDRTTLVVVPAGIEYKIDPNWSAQGYLQLNKDFYSFGPDKLEVRPVVGVTYKRALSPQVEVGAWLRYEARFQDVTGADTFQNRLRLRPYVDFKFGANPGKPGSWHARTEYEPRYVFGDGEGLFNSQQVRQAIGYKVSNQLTIDLRYSRDWNRKSAAAEFGRSNDAVTLQVNQVWMPK